MGFVTGSCPSGAVDLISVGNGRTVPPRLRRDVPGDGEPPSPAAVVPDRGGPAVPRAWTPNRVDPADHPVAVGIGTTLAVLAGVGALLTLFTVLVAIDARKEPEATASFAATLLSVPLAVGTTVFAVVAAVVFAWCGATRRAIVLGVAAGTGALLFCGWWALIR